MRRLLATLIVGWAVRWVGSGAAGVLPVQAAKSGTCASFAADLNGVTYGADTTKTVQDAQVAGKSVFVHGTFIEFTVNLDTFAVTNYTLTGAPSAKQIT